MRKPVIGITPDINEIVAPETEYVVRCNYADAISAAGGIPVILPYREDVGPFLDLIDGLLVTGGMFDIDPVLYGQTARKQYVMKPGRTNFERALILGALQRQVPILGICNGMQLLAVCLGGGLVQDIPTEIDESFEHKPEQSATIPQHEVRIVTESRLVQGIGQQTYQVNSVHHQSVLSSSGYNELAVASDGVIEAIETAEGGFAIGVQWHPEYDVAEIDRIILKSFVVAAANSKSKE